MLLGRKYSVSFFLSLPRNLYVVLVTDSLLHKWPRYPQGDAEGPEYIVGAPIREKDVYDPTARRTIQDEKKKKKTIAGNGGASSRAPGGETIRFTAKVVDMDDERPPIEAWQNDPALGGPYHSF